MPINHKGGKFTKRGKSTSTLDDEKLFDIDYEDGQMLGRVLKSLGSKRFKVYCNDNKERICKLAGSIKKRDAFVQEGSVVLISLRELSTLASSGDVGDILHLVNPKFYKKLKDEEGMNAMVFQNIQVDDLDELKRKVASNTIEKDDLFDENDTDEEEQEEGEERVELNEEEKKLAKKAAFSKKDKERDQKLKSQRENKQSSNNDDIDIDAI
jgi:initiation factor 1A